MRQLEYGPPPTSRCSGWRRSARQTIAGRAETAGGGVHPRPFCVTVFASRHAQKRAPPNGPRGTTRSAWRKVRRRVFRGGPVEGSEMVRIQFILARLDVDDQYFARIARRDASGALKELENSLRMMQTDHFDLYQLHAITSDEDVQQARPAASGRPVRGAAIERLPDTQALAIDAPRSKNQLPFCRRWRHEPATTAHLSQRPCPRPLRSGTCGPQPASHDRTARTCRLSSDPAKRKAQPKARPAVRQDALRAERGSEAVSTSGASCGPCVLGHPGDAAAPQTEARQGGRGSQSADVGAERREPSSGVTVRVCGAWGPPVQSLAHPARRVPAGAQLPAGTWPVLAGGAGDGGTSAFSQLLS